MSTYGFVYILTNRYMRTSNGDLLYKVGCTERSPHQRATELSNGSGIPHPFNVLCYAEFKDFQIVERRMHEWLSEWRLSEAREFFAGGLGFAIRLLYWNRSRLSFTLVEADPEIDTNWVLEGAGMDVESLADSLDPWKKPEPPTPEESVAKVISAAQEAASVQQDEEPF